MSATPAGVRLCREGSGVWSVKRKTGIPQAGKCGSAVLEFARNDEAGGAEAEREKACRIGAILSVLSGKLHSGSYPKGVRHNAYRVPPCGAGSCLQLNPMQRYVNLPNGEGLTAM